MRVGHSEAAAHHVLQPLLDTHSIAPATNRRPTCVAMLSFSSLSLTSSFMLASSRSASSASLAAAAAALTAFCRLVGELTAGAGKCGKRAGGAAEVGHNRRRRLVAVGARRSARRRG